MGEIRNKSVKTKKKVAKKAGKKKSRASKKTGHKVAKAAGNAVEETPKPVLSRIEGKNVPHHSTAEEMAKRQREISVAEFFTKNRHLLGFDNPRKALLATVKEGLITPWTRAKKPESCRKSGWSSRPAGKRTDFA